MHNTTRKRELFREKLLTLLTLGKSTEDKGRLEFDPLQNFLDCIVRTS